MGEPLRLWVISYDITDDQARTCVQHALERVGERRQKSVFESRLTDRQLDRVWRQLARLIDPATDSVLAWPLTPENHAQSRALGLAEVSPFDPESYELI